MKVKTFTTDSYHLEEVINEIEWENILQIIPEHRYAGTLLIIIYKENGKEK